MYSLSLMITPNGRILATAHGGAAPNLAVDTDIVLQAPAHILARAPLDHVVVRSATEADAEGEAAAGDGVDVRELFGTAGYAGATATPLIRPIVVVVAAATASAMHG